MPIDFKKLMDPAFIAESKARREKEEQEIAQKDKELKDLLSKCMDAYEELPVNERSFIRSCKTRLYSYLALSESQEKWLRDIASRLG